MIMTKLDKQASCHSATSSQCTLLGQIRRLTHSTAHLGHPFVTATTFQVPNWLMSREREAGVEGENEPQGLELNNWKATEDSAQALVAREVTVWVARSPCTGPCRPLR